MKKQCYYFLFLFITFSTPLHSFWFWESNAEKDPTKLIESLQKKQVDDPNNPLLNHNLGVALYKTGKYAEAGSSFDRALLACTDQKLKTRCMFNLGNSLYKQTIATLPVNWELKDDIDQTTIDQAITLTQKAIQQYKNLLTLNKNDLQAKTNVKKAEELLQKLAKKKKQQKQKQQKQDQNKESSPQSSNEEKNKDSQQGKEDEQKQEGKEGADKADKKSNQGNNDELNNQQQKNNSQQDAQGNTHNEPHEEKNGKDEQHQQQGMQSAQQKQESAKEGSQIQATTATDSEMHNMQAILNNLQEDESKTQKAFITRELKKNIHQTQGSQKPW